MSKGSVLSLFDYTANMVRPWAEVGYACYCADTKHTGYDNDIEKFDSGGFITKLKQDVMEMDSLKIWSMVFAAPPCTDLAVSGALHFEMKGLPAVIAALQLVNKAREICEESGAPYMIENPVSTLATYWRKPDHYFNPCDFAGYLDDPSTDAYTKKTCLWTGGGFVMPASKAIEPVLGSKMHRLPPSAHRAELRSATPMGFARAVFESNHKGEVNVERIAA